MSTEIRIFTDGASRGNPGPGGWGAVIAYPERVEEIGDGDKETTNNKMELKAVIESLKVIEPKDDQLINIFSDSKYVVNGATTWIHGWKKNNWKTSQKTDVLNKELWQELEKVMAKHNCEWTLLEGHVGIPGNERADYIASAYARFLPPKLFKGSSSEYEVDLDNFDVEASQKKVKDRSKMKAYSYLSMVDGVFARHDTWEECKARVSGKKGAKFRKSISEEDEKEITKEWGVS